MKITKITAYVLKVPLGEKRFYSSQCAFPERNSLLVKIETDEGIYCLLYTSYLKPDSYYRTFQWEKNVHMILTPEVSGVEFPE